METISLQFGQIMDILEVPFLCGFTALLTRLIQPSPACKPTVSSYAQDHSATAMPTTTAGLLAKSTEESTPLPLALSFGTGTVSDLNGTLAQISS